MLVYNWRVLSSHSQGYLAGDKQIARNNRHSCHTWPRLLVAYPRALRARGPEMGKLKCIIHCVYIIYIIYIYYIIYIHMYIYIYISIYIYIYYTVYIYLYIYIYILIQLSDFPISHVTSEPPFFYGDFPAMSPSRLCGVNAYALRGCGRCCASGHRTRRGG